MATRGASAALLRGLGLAKVADVIVSDSAAAPPLARPLGRSMRRVGNLLITISAITPALSVFIIGQQVVQQAGTGAILCFIGAGLLALATAYVYAELSSAIPLTGAEYSMLGHVMGPSSGFMMLGLNLFGGSVSLAVTALGLADYLGVLFPGVPAVPVALGVTAGTTVAAMWLPGSVTRTSDPEYIATTPPRARIASAVMNVSSSRAPRRTGKTPPRE